jgi:flagellar motility protein MotE (MotC chaperone)
MTMQKGFINLSLTGYIALGAAAIIAVVSAYAYIQTTRLEACKQEFALFKGQVEAIGKQAEIDAKRIESENIKRKEKADAQIKKLRTDNANLAKRLRDERASQNYLPAPAPGSPSPEVATFDREKLERAIQRLDEQLSGLIERGDEGLKTIEELKEWAQE